MTTSHSPWDAPEVNLQVEQQRVRNISERTLIMPLHSTFPAPFPYNCVVSVQQDKDDLEYEVSCFTVCCKSCIVGYRSLVTPAGGRGTSIHNIADLQLTTLTRVSGYKQENCFTVWGFVWGSWLGACLQISERLFSSECYTLSVKCR